MAPREIKKIARCRRGRKTRRAQSRLIRLLAAGRRQPQAGRQAGRQLDFGNGYYFTTPANIYIFISTNISESTDFVPTLTRFAAPVSPDHSPIDITVRNDDDGDDFDDDAGAFCARACLSAWSIVTCSKLE